MNGQELFNEVFAYLQQTYKGLALKEEDGEHTIVYYNGEPQFCITGFSLLYNLLRLCKLLRDEL